MRKNYAPILITLLILSVIINFALGSIHVVDWNSEETKEYYRLEGEKRFIENELKNLLKECAMESLEELLEEGVIIYNPNYN